MISKLRIPFLRKTQDNGGLPRRLNTAANDSETSGALPPHQQAVAQQQPPQEPQGWLPSMWNHSRPAVNSFQLNRMHAQHALRSQIAAANATSYLVGNPMYADFDSLQASGALQQRGGERRQHAEQPSVPLTRELSHHATTESLSHGFTGALAQVNTTIPANAEVRLQGWGASQGAGCIVPGAQLVVSIPYNSADITQSGFSASQLSQLSPADLPGLLGSQAASSRQRAIAAGHSTTARSRALEKSFADRSEKIPLPDPAHVEHSTRTVHQWLESLPADQDALNFTPVTTNENEASGAQLPAGQVQPGTMSNSQMSSSTVPSRVIRVADRSGGMQGGAVEAAPKFTVSLADFHPPPPPLSRQDATEPQLSACARVNGAAARPIEAYEGGGSSISSLYYGTPKQALLLAQASALLEQQQALATTEALMSQPAVPPRSPHESFHVQRRAGDTRTIGDGSTARLSVASGTPRVERMPTTSGTISVFRATDTGGTGYQSANSSSFLSARV